MLEALVLCLFKWFIKAFMHDKLVMCEYIRMRVLSKLESAERHEKNIPF